MEIKRFNKFKNISENSFNVDIIDNIKNLLGELETREAKYNNYAKKLSTSDKNKINYYNGKIEEAKFAIQKIRQILKLDKLEDPTYRPKK